jgi:DNA-directed RNA polymerase subunit beta'
MTDIVPILPPAFRPVSIMSQNKLPMVADPNYLYREVFDANQNLKSMSKLSDDIGPERLALYNAFKGVTGLDEPISTKNRDRRVKGVLQQVFGGRSKFSMVQRKLLSSAVDLVGRAVVVPNPDLHMDQLGLPENQAWEVYRPLIIRRLARKGMSPIDAARQVKDQSPLARQSLLDEMKERPVIMTRAPNLHRYGIMAFFPKLVKGDVLQVPPIVTKGLNMDFDGDTVSYHVPVSSEAAEFAAKHMIPSANLRSVRDFKAHYVPTNEYAGGLYMASAHREAKQPEKIFRTVRDAERAYHEGLINAGTPIVIMER